MGWAARANPIAQIITPREKLLAVIQRHLSGCETMAQFDLLCKSLDVSECERATMARLLPSHLQTTETA